MVNDSVASKFIWDGDNLLALQKGNTNYSYVADANKNIRQLVNNNTGVVVNNYEYTPFGKLYSSNEQVEQPFKFSAEYTDTETNLVYYNFRYYNPELGRWLSRDPIEEYGGWNIYCFIDNDSINYTDFLGLKIKVCGTDAEKKEINDMIKKLKDSKDKDGCPTQIAKDIKDLEKSNKIVEINCHKDKNKKNWARPDSWKDSRDPKKGSGADVNFNPKLKGKLSDGTERDPTSSLGHELHHAAEIASGTLGKTRKEIEKSAGSAENEYRKSQKLPQRKKYGKWKLKQH